MLARLIEEPEPRYVDWFAIDQFEGREIDCGFHCHWVDPTEPLAAAVLRPPDGVIITSATLRDRPRGAGGLAQCRDAPGAAHLPYAARRAASSRQITSPTVASSSSTTWRATTWISSLPPIASCSSPLQAAGLACSPPLPGSGRYRRLMVPLARAGLPLYAQHVDPIDTGTWSTCSGRTPLMPARDRCGA